MRFFSCVCGAIRVSGEQEAEKGSQRKNVAARIQMFDVAARLLRRHIAGRAHYGAVTGDNASRATRCVARLPGFFEGHCLRVGNHWLLAGVFRSEERRGGKEWSWRCWRGP